MKKGPNIHIGSPAWGSDFYDREEIIKECWEKLRSSSIILSAPRRYGKSSVMITLRNNPAEDFFPIYFELEDHSTFQGFIYELISKMIESDDSIKKTLKTIFSKVKVFDSIEELSFWEFKIKLREVIKKEGDWEDLKDKVGKLIIDLLKSKKPKKLLLIFDEFPLMLHNFIKEGKNGEEEALKLLQWLRKLRHESPFLENIRFVLGGSIGIEKVVSYLKASRLINDVTGVIIGPFKNQIAEDFIKELFKSNEIAVDRQIINAIIDTVGTMIPIYLQIMVDSVIKESNNTGKSIDSNMVKYCYKKRVHGPEYKRYFEDYYERLWRYYLPEDTRSAQRMLKELANSNEGIPYDTLFLIYRDEIGNKGDKEKFDLLLTALESDFYIERSKVEAKVYFHNKWLKDWWRIYHGF